MIQVQRLRYTYPGASGPALKGLDFAIERGEIFGLIGPSGAGKSTLQKVLIGSLKHYQGEVKVMGQEVRDTASNYYEKIGVAFEFPNFYQRFTVLENLKLFRNLYAGNTEEPRELLRQVGLEEAAGLKVAQLSKGMKMRLNFCRSIMHHPQILFLDEPTSGLDPVNAGVMKDMIAKKKQEGVTIIITTHNMKAAEELCDRVAFIVDGQIKLIDSPRELKLRLGRRRIRVEYIEGANQQAEEFEMDDLGTNESFLQLLRTHPIETIHSMETTLEQLFIDVTGKTLI
ncbi:ABC transporter ATP-binding protein [Paenibacillus sp. strain BS8-2]